MAVSLEANSSHIQPFRVASDPLTVGSRWKKWKRGFDYFVAARGVTDADQKKALLLDMAGEEVQDIFDILPAATGDDNYKKTMLALDTHFATKTNSVYERSVFRRTLIAKGETVMNYVTRLRQLAVSCEFNDVDEQIRDQVVEKLEGGPLRKKLLAEGSGLTLDKVLSISQTEESTDQQNSDMGNAVAVTQEASVNKVSGSRYKANNSSTPPTATNDRVCFRCKSPKHVASSKSCPARDKICIVCKKKGHFASLKFCRVSRGDVNATDSRASDSSESETEPLFAIEELFHLSNAANSAKMVVKLNDVERPVLIDSGATSNLLDKYTANALQCDIRPTDKRLFPYGNRNACLDLVGETDVNIFIPANGKSVNAVFYVFNGTATTLLSKHTSEQLDVLRVGPRGDEINLTAPVSVDAGVQRLVEQFPECFAGVGLLRDLQVSLHIDPSVKPVAQPVRRMPFGHRAKAKAKLDELLKADIIEKVEGPTPWVNPIVTVPKDMIFACV